MASSVVKKVLDGHDIHRLLVDFHHGSTWYSCIVNEIKKGMTITLTNAIPYFSDFEIACGAYCSWWLSLHFGGNTNEEHPEHIFTLDSLFHFVVGYQLWNMKWENVPKRWYTLKALTRIPKFIEGPDLTNWLTFHSPDFFEKLIHLESTSVEQCIIDEFIFTAILKSPVIVGVDDDTIQEWRWKYCGE